MTAAALTTTDGHMAAPRCRVHDSHTDPLPPVHAHLEMCGQSAGGRGRSLLLECPVTFFLLCAFFFSFSA